jgi:plasmid stabilization system protein ParE
MTYTVKLSNLAKRDIISIHDYIENELSSPLTAQRQIERIEEKIRSLEQFPFRYRKIKSDNARFEAIRMMPIDNYAVIYLPDKDNGIVSVSRVIYSHRNIDLIDLY